VITRVQFHLDVDSGNDAIVEDPEGAIRLIMSSVHRQLEDGVLNYGNEVYDVNGNKVGSWWIATEREETDDEC